MVEDNRKASKAKKEEYQYQQKIIDLSREHNDITKAYSTLLDNNLKKEGRLTQYLKDRIDMAKTISDITKSDKQPSEKVIEFGHKIKQLEKEIGKQKQKNFTKSGKFAKGHTLNAQKSIEKELAFIKTQRDKQSALNDVTEVQSKQAAKMFGFLEKMTGAVKKLPGGAIMLERMGFGEKNMKQIQKNMAQVAAGNMKFRDAFSKGMKGKGASKGPGVGMVAALAVALVSAGLIYGIFKGMFSVMKKFSAMIDAMGGQFGVMGTESNTLTNNLRSQRMEAIQLGFNLKDQMTATTEIANNFGIGVNQASAMSGQVLDTAKAMGLSVDESAKFYGSLVGIAGLSESAAKSVADQTYNLARSNDVSPVAVMKDMAGSAELIAKFGADNVGELVKAAVQARKLGLNLKTVDSISSSLLNFQSSLNAEVEASVITGKQLNLQKARELALTGKTSQMMTEVLKQVGGEAEFNKMNVLEREALAKAIGQDVMVMNKLVKASKDNVTESKSFAEILGKDGMSNLTSIINKLKSLGAIFVETIGPEVEKMAAGFATFLETGGFEKIKAGAQGLASTFKSIVANLGKVLTVLGAVMGASVGFMLSGGNPIGAAIGAILGAGAFGSMGAGLTTGLSSESTMKELPDAIPVNDFILTKSGKLIQTNPLDTLMGFKGNAGESQGGNQVKLNEDLKREIQAMREELKKYFDIGGTMYSQARGTNQSIASSIM